MTLRAVRLHLHSRTPAVSALGLPIAMALLLVHVVQDSSALIDDEGNIEAHLLGTG